MATKPKKRSFSSFLNQRRREVRRSSEADGHSVARGSDSSPNVETSEKGSEPEFVHDRNRAGSDEQPATDKENDSNTPKPTNGDDK